MSLPKDVYAEFERIVGTDYISDREYILAGLRHPMPEQSGEASQPRGGFASGQRRGDPADRQGLQPAWPEVHRHRVELDRLRLSDRVSNGIEILFIDVLNSEILNDSSESSDVEKLFVKEITREIKKQYLAEFNILTEDNLFTFAKQQRERNYSLLIESNVITQRTNGDARDKYLFIPRAKIENDFHNFINSPKKVFALIGDAGMGKSNFLFDKSVNLGNEELVFFYNGIDLYKGFNEAFINDLKSLILSRDIKDIFAKISSQLTERDFIFLLMALMNVLLIVNYYEVI